ncbi:MAG: histidine kinase [Lachnospiraceae bacterium]
MVTIKKMKSELKGRIKDLPIQKKMILALVSLVIVPILVLGSILSVNMINLTIQNQYVSQISLLNKSSKDIENMYKSIIQSMDELSKDSSVRAISDGNASVIDYRNVSEKMKALVESIDCCDSIVISKNGKILLQRGNRYLGENEDTHYTERIEDKEHSFWIPSHMTSFYKGINKENQNELSYYVEILNYVTQQSTGSLSIHINNADLQNLYIPYQSGSVIVNTLIMDEMGNVMAENGENTNVAQEVWEKFMEQKDRDYGYFRMNSSNNNYIVLYSKCGDSGWYLFEVEYPLNAYHTQIFFVIIAIALCIFFGIVYAWIQNKTILKPLYHLSKRIETVKAGDFQSANENLKDRQFSKDELGIVEHGFEDMTVHINRLIEQVYVQTIKTQEAEREMLLSQMNPHFLYNSLDSIHWLSFRNKDYIVSEQLEALADVYRYILKSGVNLITIQEDMTFLENYEFIWEAQLGDKVRFVQDVDESLYLYKIPKLIIQPLLENAITHGIRERKENGTIKLRIKKRGEIIEIVVIDNGKGADQKEIRELLRDNSKQEAFALKNIDARLKSGYGEEFGLTFFSKKNIGTIVRLRLKAQM